MTKSERATRIVRTLRNGQITIPAEFRRQLGLDEHSLLRMTLADGELRITPVQVNGTASDSRWFKELYDYFAPVRAEAVEKGYTEEEINAAIDEAVRAVRQQHG